MTIKCYSSFDNKSSPTVILKIRIPKRRSIAWGGKKNVEREHDIPRTCVSLVDRREIGRGEKKERMIHPL